MDNGKIKSTAGELEFERGMLVKIGGIRPQYMDGRNLIAAICLLANDLAEARDKPSLTVVGLEALTTTEIEFKSCYKSLDDREFD